MRFERFNLPRQTTGDFVAILWNHREIDLKIFESKQKRILMRSKFEIGYWLTTGDLNLLLRNCDVKSFSDRSPFNSSQNHVFIVCKCSLKYNYFRLEKRTEDLSEAISTVAKDVTRVVVETQDTKRQALLKHTRDALSAEVQIRKKWRQLIERLIHERYSV